MAGASLTSAASVICETVKDSSVCCIFYTSLFRETRFPLCREHPLGLRVCGTSLGNAGATPAGDLTLLVLIGRSDPASSQ